MTNISRNVVNDVLRCIELCSAKQNALAVMQCKHEEATGIKQHAQDMLIDIEIALCNLAASFVTAPMSGRLFLPVPNEYIDETTAHESRFAQLRAG